MLNVFKMKAMSNGVLERVQPFPAMLIQAGDCTIIWHTVKHFWLNLIHRDIFAWDVQRVYIERLRGNGSWHMSVGQETRRSFFLDSFSICCKVRAQNGPPELLYSFLDPLEHNDGSNKVRIMLRQGHMNWMEQTTSSSEVNEDEHTKAARPLNETPQSLIWEHQTFIPLFAIAHEVFAGAWKKVSKSPVQQRHEDHLVRSIFQTTAQISTETVIVTKMEDDWIPSTVRQFSLKDVIVFHLPLPL